MTKLYAKLASNVDRMIRGKQQNRIEWVSNAKDELDELRRKYFPSGSGFDNGTMLSDDSSANRLIFLTSFHHMDEHGGYAGWTYHKIYVTPSLMWGFDIRVTGVNRNDIKEYITDTFADVLIQEVN